MDIIISIGGSFAQLATPHRGVLGQSLTAILEATCASFFRGVFMDPLFSEFIFSEFF
jgi:hypothetical protein